MLPRVPAGGRLVLLFLLGFLLFEATWRGASAGTRRKRYVAFRKGSTFFYRINYKVSTLPHTTVFTQASGFKVAWELPTGASYEFNGSTCLLKSLCQATISLGESDGVFKKMLDLLASSYGKNGSAPLDPSLCKNYSHACPLHLVGLNFFAKS
ncbi:uncharacterized protein LOC111643050 [Copidosoma floridanum]|uniref:uncharacterized protein LOC111643050 n=1 Tax=Copidosoma floridanum TaxID=29053 RepID=UPI000C6F885C|nr:uncharacterized protein LOC111643050 [Copidosoma floridanum]